MLDPDFGWHLRIGEVIRTLSIPATDPFSYTMAYYPYIDHEWLTNVIFALVYPQIGLLGLSLIFSFLAVFAVGIQAFTTKSKWSLLPFLLSGTALVGFIGIRPQVISWFLFSIALIILLNAKLWQKYRWFFPFLIVLWTNLHGSFSLAVTIILLISIVNSFQRKKIIVSDFAAFSLCVLATFINPYGPRIWWEIWMTMSDSGLRWAIQEWIPALFAFNYEFLILLVLSLALVWRYYKKFSRLSMVLYVFLLLMGLSSNRHLPFWLLLSIPVTTKGLEYFYQEAKSHTEVLRRFIIGLKFFLVFIGAIIVMHFAAVVSHKSNSSLLPYPKKAIIYLRHHPSSGNVLSEYGWGGYLIWQYPEKKVFIDGRMPSWRDNNAPKNQSKNAFIEYQTIMSGDPSIADLFAKYHIDTVLINPNEDPENIVDFLQRFVPTKLANKPKLKRQLAKLGMKLVYKDEVSLVYRKE